MLAFEPLESLDSARVLILNASYEPLHVCSVKRAVSLLMHEIAERIEDSNHIIRSPNYIFAVPSVIKLKNYIYRPHKLEVAFNRKNVFKRDDYICQYCHKKTDELTIDHVLPKSRGGKTNWKNVVACCPSCNSKKRDRTPEEANMVLKKKPYVPRFLFSSSFGTSKAIDPSWEKYLPKTRASNSRYS